MLADTPIAYVETVATAEAHSTAHWERRVTRASAGCERSQFVVELGGEWVATAGGYADEDGTSVMVVGVFIAPEHRGRGLLELLVESVAQWAMECGRERLALEVAKENPRAIAAYTRLGFTMTGAAHPHPLYSELTELEMTRPTRL
jgi:predicted GNAT family acetyltransferase